MTDPHPALRRAREEIEAARLLTGSNFAAAAVSRSYYAAEVALLSLGETRSKHSGVVSDVPSGEAQLAVTDAEESVGLVEARLSGTSNGTAAP